MRLTFVRRSAVWLLGISLVGAAPAVRASDSEAADRVERAIARLAAVSGGTVGVVAVEIETGRRVAFNPDERFPMASTFKLPLALRVLEMVDRGELRLDRPVPLTEHDYRPGYSPTADFAHGSPMTLTVGRLLELMLVDSDNTAADALMRLAGGPTAVTARLGELGATGIEVDRYEAQLFTDGVGIGDVPESEWTVAHLEALADKVPPEARHAAEARYATDPRDTATPEAMATLAGRAFRGEALSPESTALLVRLMTASATGAARIKGLLPTGTPVAHKSGTQAGTTNDVGVVTLPEGARHLAIAIYVKASTKPVEERERAMAEIARTVYDYYLVADGATTPTSQGRP
jgi:beta-lactamase class A